MWLRVYVGFEVYGGSSTQSGMCDGSFGLPRQAPGALKLWGLKGPVCPVAPTMDTKNPA